MDESKSWFNRIFVRQHPLESVMWLSLCRAERLPQREKERLLKIVKVRQQIFLRGSVFTFSVGFSPQHYYGLKKSQCPCLKRRKNDCLLNWFLMSLAAVSDINCTYHMMINANVTRYQSGRSINWI